MEVPRGLENKFEAKMEGCTLGRVGFVNEDDQLVVHGLDANEVISIDVGTLKETWQRPLRW